MRHTFVSTSPVLRRFLQTPEDAMEELRKSLDKRPAADVYQEFKAAFSRELDALQPPPREEQLEQCRVLVEGQLGILRDLGVALRRAAGAQRVFTAASATVQERLASACAAEASALADANALQQPRVQLLAAVRRQNEVMAEAPSLHYDILVSAVDLELADAEAMQEALGSLDQLRQAAEDGRRRADALEASVRKVQGGGRAEGDEPSSGLGRLFGPRDRAGQPDRLRRELEQTREEAAVAEEWHAAARSVAAGLEVGAFLAEKVAVHRWVKDTFGGCAHGTAQALASVWAGLAPKS